MRSRRRERLLLLQADQRRLGLLVGKPEIEPARDQQRRADQGDEQQRVFAEKPAPRRAVARASAVRRRPMAATRRFRRCSSRCPRPNILAGRAGNVSAIVTPRRDRRLPAYSITSSARASNDLRHGESERLRGLQVDRPARIWSAVDRQIGRLRARQNSADIASLLANASPRNWSRSSSARPARRIRAIHRSPGAHAAPPAARGARAG